MADANINKEVLKWARESLSLSVDDAARKLVVTVDTIEAWESGTLKPSISKLYKIAELYRRPFAVFFFPAPPEAFKPIRDFRRFPDNIPPDSEQEFLLRREILRAHSRRLVAIDLYALNDDEPKPFELSGRIGEDPQSLAVRIRQYFEISTDHDRYLTGYGWLNHWKKILEANGVLIFQTTKIALSTMRGACIHGDILPVILINSNDSENGRIFSMFHELVHLVVGQGGISNFTTSDQHGFDPIEIFCNQVAAEVLVPSESLINEPVVRQHKGSEWTDVELTRLSNKYGVSQEVILRRLLTLNKTSQEFYRQFRSRPRQNKKSTGGTYYYNVLARNGRLLIGLALSSYQNNKLDAASFYDATQVKASSIEKLIKVYGGI